MCQVCCISDENCDIAVVRVKKIPAPLLISRSGLCWKSLPDLGVFSLLNAYLSGILSELLTCKMVQTVLWIRSDPDL
jgi:hypothetical protein